MIDAPARFAIQQRHPLYDPAQALRHLAGQRQSPARHQQGKLFPSEPIGSDALLADFPQPLADDAQHLIPQQVAIFVVEVLETIDVGHDQREGLLVADQAVHLQIEGAAVEQGSERVLGGHLARLVQRRL
ncbi:hypothetical protein D3C85_1453920 [compost metagenome]